MGGAIVAPSVLININGCQSSQQLDWSPTFFTHGQALLVSVIAEIIIPSDGTPGAKDARVPEYIEDMVSQVFSESQRTRFMNGLKYYDESARVANGKIFVQCNPQQQFDLVQQFNTEALQNNSGSSFLLMKQLTLRGFCTSEIGATQVLQYLQVPGKYEGCVPLEDVGNAWAFS